jgi:hypothetical protein
MLGQVELQGKSEDQSLRVANSHVSIVGYFMDINMKNT